MSRPNACILFCKDIELTCDEKATRNTDKKQRVDYCQALLTCSVNGKMIEVCPVAFGEVGVKERIKQILNYKKPFFWMIVFAVIVCIIVSVCFLTNPKSEAEGEKTNFENMETVSDLTSDMNGEEMIQGIAEYDHIEPDEQGYRWLSDEVYDAQGKTRFLDMKFRNSESWAGNSKQAKTEFTMEDLIALCDAGSETLKDALTDFAEDGELPYSNLERDEMEGSLTWAYFCTLSYGEREYRLQISYWKPETAEEYGYKPDELSGVRLNYPEIGDTQLLYESEERFTPDLNIRSFLEREYDIQKFVELELPEGLELGNYRADMSVGDEGCLFTGDYEETPHSEFTPEEWYAPGGIEFIQKEYFPGDILFKDGKLKEVFVLMNHSGPSSEFEILEGCSMQAILCEYFCDLFTLPEADEYKQEHGLSEEEFDSTSDYWYVFFAEPDSEYVYVLYLNQKYFEKEDIVELARSIEFRVK